MSSVLQQYPDEKCHSPLDDLQSVFWVAFEKSLNHLDHAYSGMTLAARCLTEYDPATKRGGNRKIVHFYTSPFIKFTENPAFSSLLYDFCEMVHSADAWETRLIEHGDSAGPQPPEVPDHDRILERFRQALNSPQGDWSPNLSSNTGQLWEAMKTVRPYGVDST